MNDLEFNNTDHNREYKQKFLQIMEENLLEVERIDFASTMESLQISSLAFVKIVVFLEEELNLRTRKSYRMLLPQYRNCLITYIKKRCSPISIPGNFICRGYRKDRK